MSALLVGIFGILDIWIVPLTRLSAWFIRFVVITPAILLCFLLTFTKFFKHIMQIALCLSVLIVGLGFVAMVGLLHPSEQGFYLYYVGIIQVLIATYVLLRIRFVYASIVGLIFIASNEFVAIFYNNMLASPDLIPIFLNNNFFLISTNVMGMIACYFNEYYLRHTFLLRKRIQYEEEAKLESTQEELQKTKQALSETQSMMHSMEQETDIGFRSISNTIKNKQAVQKELNKNAARKMLMLRNSARELKDKIPKALTKTVNVVLDGFEQGVLARLEKTGAGKTAHDYAELKKKIAAGFQKQNLSNIEHFISEKIREHSEEAIGTLDDAFKNMSDILDYIHAIIAYQRGQKVGIEEHVNAALKRVYYNMQYTYKLSLIHISEPTRPY